MELLTIVAGVLATIGAAVVAGWFTLRAARSKVEQADGYRGDAKDAAEKAEQTAMAFASGFSDLYRKIEECRADAQEAKNAALEAQASEERCLAEQKRLEAIMEGIISERRSQ